MNTSFLFLILEIDGKDINLFSHKQKGLLRHKAELMVITDQKNFPGMNVVLGILCNIYTRVPGVCKH